MNGFSYLLLGFGLFFLWRGLQNYANVVGLKQHHIEEMERTRLVIERDPTNSGTRAKLAAFLIEAGDLEGGIHEYRTAIGLSPQGPFSTDWKRKLKVALELQEKLARGERIAGFHEWRVCEKCQNNVSVRDKTCPRCGNVLSKGFLEWVTNAETQREVWKEGIPIAVVLIIVAEIFMVLPFEVKGTLIISTLLVSGWLILRSFDR